MIKPTFITDEATQDPVEFAALARAHGVDAVELRTVFDTHCASLGDADRRQLTDVLRGEGLQVCCIDSAVFKADLLDDLTPEFDKLARSLEAAQRFDAPYVRIFTFWREAGEPGREARILAAVDKAVDMATQAGKCLLVENGKRTTHATGSELAQLMKHRGGPALQVLWDPANSLYGGTDADPLAQGFDRAAQYIRHVHLKQVHRHQTEDRLVYGPMQGGQLDIDRMIAQLVSAGYAGYISLETHWRPDKWFTEMELDYPGGTSFSRNGHDATSQSLAFLSHRLSELQ